MAYWALGDYARQRDFLLNCINGREVNRRSQGAEKHNSVSREYHLGLGNEKHHVCHSFFHATLSLSKSTSNHTLAKRSSNNTVRPDMRGRAVPPHNKTHRQISQSRKSLLPCFNNSGIFGCILKHQQNVQSLLRMDI